MGRINIKQLGFALGAEVTGIDLRQPLNDLARKEILDAWHRHLVLIFPDQDLDANQATSARWMVRRRLHACPQRAYPRLHLLRPTP